MIKNILIPTDGSNHADRAVKCGADLAAKYGAKVNLLYVYPRGDEESLRHMARVEHLTEREFPRAGSALMQMPVLSIFEPASGEGQGLPDSVYEKIGAVVLEHAQRLVEEKGVKEVRTHCTDGDPATRVVEYVDNNDIDLVVMGSRGLGGLKALVLGSVSHKVSQSVPCSYFVVK